MPRTGRGNALSRLAEILELARFNVGIAALPPFRCDFVGVLNSRERELHRADCGCAVEGSCPANLIVAHDKGASLVLGVFAEIAGNKQDMRQSIVDGGADACLVAFVTVVVCFTVS